MKRIWNALLCFLLVTLMLLPPLTLVAAENTVIKVGYIEGYGIKKEGEVYEGYAIEYLNELSKYTGFTYEFVEGDWIRNLAGIESGAIDMIAPMPEASWIGDVLSYSENEIGFEYLGLYAKATNEDLYFDDFTEFDGMKVGAFNENESFEKYKEENDFTASYVFYNSIEEMLVAIKSGEIDAYILESTAQYEGVKMIAKLGVTPIYLATAKDNTVLIEKINDGISEIRRQNIYYTAKLHDSYYGKDVIGAPAFTHDETAFINSKTEIRIAFDPKMYVTELYDEEKGTYIGIFPELVRLVTEKSGLTVTFVPVNDYAEAKSLFERGEVDAITNTNHKDGELNCMHTDTLYSLPLVLTAKEDCYLSNGDKVGYLEKYAENLPVFEAQFPNFEFISFDSSKEMFESIRKGHTKGGIVNSFSLNMAMARGIISDMEFFSSTNISLDVRLEVSNDVNSKFVSIFNKAFKRISIEEMNTIIMENTVTPGGKISFLQILNQYLFHFIVFALVVATSVLSYILHTSHKNRKRLYHIAYTDSLTGRANYHKFKLDANKILSKNMEHEYRVTKFDVDRFKVFNKLFGRISGDELLRTISNCLAQICNSQYEAFARVSADEFIVLRRCKTANDTTVERIRFEKMLQEALVVSYDIRINYGRYKIKIGEQNIDALYEKANFAHRAAKSKSAASVRDCEYEDSLMNDMIRQKELENNMEEALENEEFIVFVQPKYRLIDENIGGAEALVRWQPADKDMIYPNSFIPLFEQNGFITQLDMYMFEKVCYLLSQWAAIGKELPTTSVNFSRLHLNDEHFVQKLIDLADKYQVPHHLLEIELTESVMFDGESTLLLVLENLHDAGFTLSMDDFGSGYSSLGMLKNLPVDVIKLDRSFFLSARNNKKALAVLTHVIDMARDMEINTVAEGVEFKEDVDLLRSLGCDMVQGYYYAKPMPIKEFESLI